VRYISLDDNDWDVVAINIATRTIDIKRMKKTMNWHPTSVFVDSRGPDDDEQADAMSRLCVWVKDHGGCVLKFQQKQKWVKMFQSQ
jgi:phenylalanyl-tRNA synthetase beta subunit